MIMSEFDSNVIEFPGGGRVVVKGMSDDDFLDFEAEIENALGDCEPLSFTIVNLDGDTVELSLEELWYESMQGPLGKDGWEDSAAQTLHPFWKDVWWFRASSEERRDMVKVMMDKSLSMIMGNQSVGPFDFITAVKDFEEYTEGMVKPLTDEEHTRLLFGNGAENAMPRFAGHFFQQLTAMTNFWLRAHNLVPTVVGPFEAVDKKDMLLMFFQSGANEVKE